MDLRLNNLRFIILFLVLGVCQLLSSCNKAKPIELAYVDLNFPLNTAINDVLVVNDSSLYIANGNLYQEGKLYHSTDEGKNWSSIYDHEHQLRKLRWSNNELFCISLGNTIIGYIPTTSNLRTITLAGWENWTDLAFWPNGSGLATVGYNLGYGEILRFDTAYTPDYSDSLGYFHEFREIHLLEDSTVYISGYGIVMKSTDRGQTWTDQLLRGDFFRAMSFADENTAYIIGQYGSIYKTTDGGDKWNRLRNGNTLKVTRFYDVHFTSVDKGVIVGGNGLIWTTIDGGISWKVLENIPTESNWLTVHGSGDTFYIGSSTGELIAIEI
ncbi:MAG: YCF48-related protein [Saprospiraceae bacterium]|nr:YCF48-related protein [Saprospiraceae bacterium]